MPNYFTEVPDIEFHLRTLPYLREIARLKERNFADAGRFDDAPVNEDDALENYRLVLNLLGELAAEHIAPRAPSVDAEGSRLVDGHVYYAEGIRKAIQELAQADVMGMTLPRRYGGINFPTVVYSMAIELIARADASLMTVFGLQDIAETINSFADEDLKQQYLPPLCRGERTGAMVLTEPDAGSDLQAITLKAFPDPQVEGLWRLNGVKRFISNGCGETLLVMARSEEGTTDARGISLFVCDSDETVRIRRLENKLGIKGSPTCEMQFNDTPARLVGRRKYGLIKYVMELMNGARLAIAGQAIGIAQAAYAEALEYARSREQFRRRIFDFPAVRDMLVRMSVTLEAMRALTYHTACVVDLAHLIEANLEDGTISDPEQAKTYKQRLRNYTRWAALLTPMSKAYTTEEVQRIASDAIQVHGGSGYMKDYNVERHFRDARITNIYEGTTQLQVVAALGGITGGAFQSLATELIAGLEGQVAAQRLQPLKDAVETAEACVAFLRAQPQDYLDLRARDLTDLCIYIVTGLFLLDGTRHAERKGLVFDTYLADALPRIHGCVERIRSNNRATLDQYETLLQ